MRSQFKEKATLPPKILSFCSRVLYFSLHRYDNGLFFPCSEEANYDHVGAGPGRGFNFNVAWNGSAKGDVDYLLAFYHLLMPVALEVGMVVLYSQFLRHYQNWKTTTKIKFIIGSSSIWGGFCKTTPSVLHYVLFYQSVLTLISLFLSYPAQFDPELVLVSCGFDAGLGDHLGGYRVTPTGFAHMTRLLTSLAQGKVVLALEGGKWACRHQVHFVIAGMIPWSG